VVRSLRFSPGAAGIAQTLDASIGHVNQRTLNFTATAGTTGGVPPCWRLGYQATIAIQTGIIMGVDHVWSASGFVENHIGRTCCMDGVHYLDEHCHSCVSTASGSAWSNGAIDTILNEPCE